MNRFALGWILQWENRENTLHPSHASQSYIEISGKPIRVATEQELDYQFLHSGHDLSG